MWRRLFKEKVSGKKDIGKSLDYLVEEDEFRENIRFE